jgi:hypothetical protein
LSDCVEIGEAVIDAGDNPAVADTDPGGDGNRQHR